MLAATILSSRALAPVELAIANWKSFVTARQSWRRLSEALAAAPVEEERIALPAPEQQYPADRHHAGAARHRRGRAARGELHAHRRQRARRDRPERIGQDLAGARAGRRLEAGARRHPARRGDARSMEPGCVRALHRLPAAGGRAVRRNGGGEHRPLRAGGRSDQADRGGDRGRRPRRHPAAAAGLQDPGRRRRRHAFGRAAAAHRAGARALRRSVPGGARRAELQSRRERRGGADPCDQRDSRARRHRGRDRAPAERGGRGRSRSGAERGPRAGVRRARADPPAAQATGAGAGAKKVARGRRSS